MAALASIDAKKEELSLNLNIKKLDLFSYIRTMRKIFLKKYIPLNIKIYN